MPTTDNPTLGDDNLRIQPLPTARGTAIFEALAGFDDDFIAALELGRLEMCVMQDRETPTTSTAV